MSLAELVKLVPPPAAPVFAGPVEWRAAIEAELGLTLPQDIIEFALVYGSGTFSLQFGVYNPFDPGYVTFVRDISAIFAEKKAECGNLRVPYAIFPQAGGLLCWGTDLNGSEMFWLTEGPSDSWPIVLWDRDYGRFERWEMPMTEFLVAVFSNTVECVLWSPEMQRELQRMFEPADYR